MLNAIGISKPAFGVGNTQNSHYGSNRKKSICQNNIHFVSGNKVTKLRFGDNGQKPITFMTYNLQDFMTPALGQLFGKPAKTLPQLEGFKQIIQTVNPDVIAVQEPVVRDALRNTMRQGGFNAPGNKLKAFLDAPAEPERAWLQTREDPLVHFVRNYLNDEYNIFYSDGTNDASGKALAFLVKKDIECVRKTSHYIKLRNNYNRSNPNVGIKQYYVFPRDLLELELRIPNPNFEGGVEHITVLNYHGTSPVSSNASPAAWRSHEIEMEAIRNVLKEKFSRDPDANIILMGDLNLPKGDSQTQVLLPLITETGLYGSTSLYDPFDGDDSVLTARTEESQYRGPYSVSSRRGAVHFYRPDYILLSNGLNARVIREKSGVVGERDPRSVHMDCSDHFPLIVKLTRNLAAQKAHSTSRKQERSVGDSVYASA